MATTVHYLSSPILIQLSSPFYPLTVTMEKQTYFSAKNINVRFLTLPHIQNNLYRYDTGNSCANVYFCSEVQAGSEDDQHPESGSDAFLRSYPGPDQMHSRDPHPGSGSDAFPRSASRIRIRCIPKLASQIRIKCIPKIRIPNPDQMHSQFNPSTVPGPKTRFSVSSWQETYIVFTFNTNRDDLELTKR
jgi:hypothetical protein